MIVLEFPFSGSYLLKNGAEEKVLRVKEGDRYTFEENKNKWICTLMIKDKTKEEIEKVVYDTGYGYLNLEKGMTLAPEEMIFVREIIDNTLERYSNLSLLVKAHKKTENLIEQSIKWQQEEIKKETK